MADPQIKEVIKLPINNLRDIASLMEEVARQIRAEEFKTKHGAAVFLDENDEVCVFSWGEADILKTTGLLAIGLNWLTSRKAERKA